MGYTPVQIEIDNMAYQIYIGDEQDYVTVKHTGDVTFRELEEARARINTILLEKCLNKIFVDVTEVTSVLKKVEQICFIGSHGDVYPEDVRISVVVSEKLYEHDKSIDELAELLNIDHKLFVNINEATEWLNSDKK